MCLLLAFEVSSVYIDEAWSFHIGYVKPDFHGLIAHFSWVGALHIFGYPYHGKPCCHAVTDLRVTRIVMRSGMSCKPPIILVALPAQVKRGQLHHQVRKLFLMFLFTYAQQHCHHIKGTHAITSHPTKMFNWSHSYEKGVPKPLYCVSKSSSWNAVTCVFWSCCLH